MTSFFGAHIDWRQLSLEGRVHAGLYLGKPDWLLRPDLITRRHDAAAFIFSLKGQGEQPIARCLSLVGAVEGRYALTTWGNDWGIATDGQFVQYFNGAHWWSVSVSGGLAYRF